jgi:hypothetical protein
MKTRQKTVLSMIDPFIAHETLYECPSCSRTFVSDALPRLVQPRCNVAYDLLVFVGQALFQQHRTIEEVRIELFVRNVRINTSEIGLPGSQVHNVSGHSSWHGDPTDSPGHEPGQWIRPSS